MKILLLILSFCLLNSCFQPNSVQSQIKVQNNKDGIKNIEILERLPNSLEKINLPKIKEIGEFALIRNSEKKDDKGWMIPPYKNAEIEVSFEESPQIGEKVTVIPLKVKIEPFQLEILKVTKTKVKGCVDKKKKDFFWAAELERIFDSEILNEPPATNGFNNQMPFSVFVIYPSVQFAKSLNISSISKTLLPNNISLKRIESAIDIDNDNKPDLLSVRFCCGEPNKESDEKCPYICQKYYKKNNGVWKIIDIHDFQEIC